MNYLFATSREHILQSSCIIIIKLKAAGRFVVTMLSPAGGGQRAK
jgi:hypothetical protein